MDDTASLPAAPADRRAHSELLPPGTPIASRFSLEALAGRGGMGDVYRARDSLSGHTVALKLLHASATQDSLRRFTREAELLTSLRHPGIVAHVAHGLSEQGLPYLAMEWLEGEDLGRRLIRQPLSLAETLALVRSAAQALAAAHLQGVIHRDLKPSNLFLRHQRPEQVVLLDFGLARHAVPSLALTQGNQVLGTPGYMAPEQASGQGEPTPAADLFSLGCVLYECLTGQPPFSAPHFTAVLAKILFADPTPLRTLRPELPEALQALVQRLLAKEPQRRLSQARALLEELQALQSLPDLSGPRPGRATRPSTTSSTEQQLISVLLASLPCPTAPEEPTADLGPRLALRDWLQALLQPHGAQAELLADGSLVATLLPGRGTAADQATLAARCALALKERWPEASVVLATGRGVVEQRLPMGEVMDRAGLLLHQLQRLPDSASAHVVLEEVSAGLLGPGFLLARPLPDLYLLQGEHLSADESRPLLGRPTPCVGREQELSVLELALAACVEELAAQALLVLAPAGTGKSRLRHEFLRRLERSGRSVLVLLARADPMGRGSLLGQALRRLCGVSSAESLEESRYRLMRRLGQHLPLAQAQEVLELLGELCGIPLEDEPSPRLRAARADPTLLSAQLSRALRAFLQAECAHHPVVLVLEDLHWGDEPTVHLVGEALRELAEQPLLVLALARPEVKRLFPGLWPGRLQELSLRGLGKKACERLVREVLGPQVPEATLARLVEQAQGNALFLEELIRSVVEGRGETPPQTVLALLQARLQRLEPLTRQVLLAASVFGGSFWLGGVRALLGEAEGAEALEQHLQQLVALELVEFQPRSCLLAQQEYRFRHALMRDAAYGLLLEAHRQRLHGLAGAWLELAGEGDPRVLAGHYQAGQEPERALHYLALAAEQHFERHDFQGMDQCVEAALGLGAQGEVLARLRTLQATAAFWRDDLARLFEVGEGVLPELRPGSLPWCRMASGLFIANTMVGRVQRMAELAGALLSTVPEAEAREAYLEAINFAASINVWAGAREQAQPFLARVLEVDAQAGPEDLLVHAWSAHTQAFFAHFFGSRPWQAREWIDQASHGLLEVGSERNALSALGLAGLVYESLGDREGAVARLREGLGIARKLGQPMVTIHVASHLAFVLSASPDPAHREEAAGLVRERAGEEQPNPLHTAMVRAALAQLAAGNGALAEAERLTRSACEGFASLRVMLPRMHALLSSVLLAQGRTAESRQAAEAGARELERLGNEGAYATTLHLALAEACLAEGDKAAGEAALRRAWQGLQARAADVPEGPARERFHHQVPEHARVLERVGRT